jgi:WD40 repeat protein
MTTKLHLSITLCASAICAGLVSAQQQAAFNGHTLAVTSITASKDGRLVVSAGYDKTIRVWNTLEQTAERTSEPQPAWIRGVALSADEGTIFTAGDDGFVRRFDAKTLNEVANWKAHNDVITAFAASRDGQLLATGSTGTDVRIRVWSATTGTETMSIADEAGALSLAFSDDGKLLAWGSFNGTARVFDIDQQTPVSTLNKHDQAVHAVAFSPDATKLVTCAEKVSMWDVKTGNPIPFDLQPPAEKSTSTLFVLDVQPVWLGVLCATWSDDGKLLVTGDDLGRVRSWNSDDGKLVDDIGAHQQNVAALCFTAQGKRLVSAAADGSVRVWILGAISERNSMTDFSQAVSSAALSSNGKLLVTCEYGGTVKLWETSSWKNLATWKDHTSCVFACDFSHDGKLFATADTSGKLIITDLETNKAIHTLNMGSFLAFALFSVDDKTIAVGPSSLGGIMLINSVTGENEGELAAPSEKVFAIAYSPDGRYLASEDASDIILWDLTTKQLALRFKGHAKRVTEIRFSHDSRYLLSTGDDGVLKLWSVETQECLQTIQANVNESKGLALSADDAIVAMGSSDKAVKLWDRRTGKNLATIDRQPESVWGVLLHPEQRLLYVFGGNSFVPQQRQGFLKVWDFTALIDETLGADKPLEGDTD